MPVARWLSSTLYYFDYERERKEYKEYWSEGLNVLFQLIRIARKLQLLNLKHEDNGSKSVWFGAWFSFSVLLEALWSQSVVGHLCSAIKIISSNVKTDKAGKDVQTLTADTVQDAVRSSKSAELAIGCWDCPISLEMMGQPYPWMRRPASWSQSSG